MSEQDIDTLAKFLHTARWPVLHERLPTFFNIAGIAHKELPLSNCYGFFFRSEESHGLGKLFGKSLLDVVRGKGALPDGWPEMVGPVRVAREYPMNKGQWLDLLVHDGLEDRHLQEASFVILVENKVRHELVNELCNYWDSINEPTSKLGIVLGARHERDEENWLFVAHWELAAAVRKRLGPLEPKANPRYLPLLEQLLEHMTYMRDTQHDNFTQAFDFVYQHREQVAQAQRVLEAMQAPQALADAITRAFGDGYEQAGCFPNRVQLRRRSGGPLDYIVYFGHLLDISQPAGYTIALYIANGGTAGQAQQWLAFLRQLAPGLKRLNWFDFDDLVAGREYLTEPSSLSSLELEIRRKLETDWLPLEQVWAGAAMPTELPLLGE